MNRETILARFDKISEDLAEAKREAQKMRGSENITIKITREDADNISRILRRIIAPIDEKDGIFTFNVLTCERAKILALLDKICIAGRP